MSAEHWCEVTWGCGFWGGKKTQKTNQQFIINPCVARRYSYLSRCIKQSQLVVLFLDFDVDCKTNKSLGSYINAYRIPENHLTLLGLYGRPIKKKKRRNWTPILWLYNLAVDRLRMKNMTSRPVKRIGLWFIYHRHYWLIQSSFIVRYHTDEQDRPAQLTTRTSLEMSMCF